jgi:hypothetical protein
MSAPRRRPACLPSSPLDWKGGSSARHILGGVDELMFNEGDLRLALEAQTKKMAAAVDAEAVESLKQADTDQWAAALGHHFAVACPELKTDDLWMALPKEIGVDVSRDPMRAIIDPYSDAVRNYPGYRVVVHVPFEGEADVFKLRPGSFNFNPPRSRIKSDELVLTIEYPHDHPPDIDATVNAHWPGDEERLADLNVFFVQTPQARA